MLVINRRPVADRSPGGGIAVRAPLGVALESWLSDMTFATVGTLGAVPGQRDTLVAHLRKSSAGLAEIGCLVYEVGIDDEQPDTVFVVELWESAEAHRASLALSEVQAAIAQARPLLSGEYGGFRFDVVGSPLRD